MSSSPIAVLGALCCFVTLAAFEAEGVLMQWDFAHQRLTHAVKVLEEGAQKLGNPEIEVLALHVQKTGTNGTDGYGAAAAVLRKLSSTSTKDGAARLHEFCASESETSRQQLSTLQQQQQGLQKTLVAQAGESDHAAKKISALKKQIKKAERAIKRLSTKRAREHKAYQKRKAKKASMKVKSATFTGKLTLDSVTARAAEEAAADVELQRNIQSETAESQAVVKFGKAQLRSMEASRAKSDEMRELLKKSAELKVTLIQGAQKLQGLSQALATAQKYDEGIKCASKGSQPHWEEQQSLLQDAFNALTGRQNRRHA